MHIIIIVLLVVLLVVTLAKQIPRPEIFEVEGRPVLPIVDLSLNFALFKRQNLILEDTERKVVFNTSIPQLQVKAALKICEEHQMNLSELAEAKVYFQKNIFAQVINPYLVITKKGFIPTPK